MKEKQGLPKLKIETNCQKSKSTTEVGIQSTPFNSQTKTLLHTISLRWHEKLLQTQNYRIQFSFSYLLSCGIYV